MTLSSRSWTARLLGALLIALPAAVALALLGLALVETAALKAFVDRLSPDGDAEQFGVGWLRGLQGRALAAGVGYGALAALALVPRLRDGAGAAVSELLRSLRAALGALRMFVVHERAHAVALGALTLGCLGLALILLGQPMRCDEAGTYVTYGSRPVSFIVSQYTNTNNHILHSLAVHASTALLGNAPWAVRLPALVGGVLTVPLGYLAARRLAGREAGLLMAAAVATWHYLIDAATNARGYPFVNLAFLGLLALLCRAPAEGLRGKALPTALLVAAGALAVPTMLYPFAIVMLWVALGQLAGAPRGELPARAAEVATVAAASVCAVAVVYTPVLLNFDRVLVDSSLGAQGVAATRMESVIGLWATLATRIVWRHWFHGRGVVVCGLAGGLWLSSLALPPRLAGGARRLAWAAVLAVSLLVFATRRPPPTWSWGFFLLLLLLLASAAFAGLGRWAAARFRRPRVAVLAPALAALLLVTANLVAFARRPEPTRLPWWIGYPDAHAAAQVLGPLLRPSDRVAGALIHVPAVLYYLQRARPDPTVNHRFLGTVVPGGVVYLIVAGHQDEAHFSRTLIQAGLDRVDVVAQLPASRLLRYARGR